MFMVQHGRDPVLRFLKRNQQGPRNEQGAMKQTASMDVWCQNKPLGALRMPHRAHIHCISIQSCHSPSRQHGPRRDGHR